MNKDDNHLTTTISPFLCFLWFAEPIQASERQDKRVFLLDSCTPEQALGIRLQSIQDVISQVMNINTSYSVFIFLLLHKNTVTPSQHSIDPVLFIISGTNTPPTEFADEIIKQLQPLSVLANSFYGKRKMSLLIMMNGL